MHYSTSLLFALSAVALGQQSQSPTPDPNVPLTFSALIPRIGLGTARISGNTSEVIAKAIENGYRHFDCATRYNNQKEIGIGIKEGLKRTGINRNELWITSKLWSDRHKRADAALQEALDQLGLDYLDLWLIHWPQDNGELKPSFDHVDTWKAVQKAVKADLKGGSRFIGVSNFAPKQIDDILALDGLKPEFHEFETHPYLPQEAFVKYNMDRNITVIAYSPLGNTQNSANMGVTVDRNAVPEILKHDVITSIAKQRQCTPAQVVLGWNLRRGVVVIPKASRSDHQQENISTSKKCVTDEDAQKINSISKKIRFYPSACGYGLEEGCAAAKANQAGGKGR